MGSVQWLRDLPDHSIGLAGGKGAHLAAMLQAGLSVPDGFVVTADAYRRYLDAAGVQQPDAESFQRPLPDDLATEIVAACDQLGAPVAVRSSATSEDLTDASFAGQLESVLDVEGADAVLEAVRQCWASLWTPRAIDYRAHRGVLTSDVAMGVVVQRMIRAQAAGVLFTANPTNGRRTETLVNAAWGSALGVVSGRVTPESVTIADGRVVQRRSPAKQQRVALDSVEEAIASIRRNAEVLTDAQALELAGLGATIASLFRAPQDVEWALADGQIFVLQARPITALPEPTGPIPTEWVVDDHTSMYARASIIEQLPDPLSPLFADLVRPAVVAALRAVLGKYFDPSLIKPGDIDFPMVNGYPYYRYSRAGMNRLLLATPKALPILVGKGDGNGITNWRSVHADYQDTVQRARSINPADTSAVDLCARASELIAAGIAYYSSVQTVIPLAATSEIAFTKLYNRIGRGTHGPTAGTFLVGFDSLPVRAEKSAFNLARWALENPDVASAIILGQPIPGELGAEWQRRLDRHLATFGHVVYNLDIMVPVPADDPASTVAMVKHYLTGEADDPFARQAQLADARVNATRDLAKRLDPARRKTIGRLLAKAQELAPQREDALADVGLAWPVARRFLLEVGRRMADAQAIDAPEDVFWLTADELGEAAESVDAGAAQLASHMAEIGRRREIWRGQRLAQPPQLLPKGSWGDIFKRWLPGVESEQPGATLKGLGASAGKVVGQARVVHGPEDAGELQPGEILVAHMTTPAYTPMFAIAAGVVTDIGGPLSHSSIVAREYAIPAVLGVGTATARIETGDQITVDGDRGVVLLPGAGDAPLPAPTRGWLKPLAGTGLTIGSVVGAAALLARRHRNRD